MLYRFKSQATTDLTLLQADGETVLQLLGKTPAAQGVITAEQLPAAITTLEAAAHTDRTLARDGPVEAGEDCEDDRDASVSLSQRLAPFIRLLREAEQAQKAVVWGT